MIPGPLLSLERSSQTWRELKANTPSEDSRFGTGKVSEVRNTREYIAPSRHCGQDENKPGSLHPSWRILLLQWDRSPLDEKWQKWCASVWCVQLQKVQGGRVALALEVGLSTRYQGKHRNNTSTSDEVGDPLMGERNRPESCDNEPMRGVISSFSGSLMGSEPDDGGVSSGFKRGYS